MLAQRLGPFLDAAAYQQLECIGRAARYSSDAEPSQRNFIDRAGPRHADQQPSGGRIEADHIIAAARSCQ